MTTADRARQRLAANRRRLTRFPFEVTAFLVLVAVGALVVLWLRRDVVAAPWCGETLLTPEVGCPRSWPGGRWTFDSYELVLASSRATLTALRVSAVLVALVAIALALGCVIAWRRNVALADWLEREEPTAEHVELTYGQVVPGAVGAAGIILVAAAIGPGAVAGGLAVGSVGGVTGGIAGMLLAAGVVVVGLYLVWPRGCFCVGVHDEGVRLARKGRVSFHPWLELQLYPGAGTTLRVLGERTAVGLPASVAGPIESRLTEAWVEDGWRRIEAGELVELGSVTLSRSSVAVVGATVPLDQLTGVTFRNDDKLLVLAFHRRGDEPATVLPENVANVEALSRLLRLTCGVSLPAEARSWAVRGPAQGGPES